MKQQKRMKNFFRIWITMVTATTFGQISGAGVTDIDGNNYSTVIVESQEWMVENLKTTRYNDYTIIPVITNDTDWSILDSGAYSYYNNEPDNATTYGHLYNWYTVETNKLCPEGWHVPTSIEWIILDRFLAENGGNYDGSLWSGTQSDSQARSKIAKSLAHTSSWATSAILGSIGNNQNNNNYSGFSALAGGSRNNNGVFYGMGTHGRFWTASVNASGQATRRVLDYERTDIRVSNADKKYGFCVRCVKDTSSLSIIQNDFRNSFVAYPNPTKGTFLVDLGENLNKVGVSLIDLTGRIINSEEFRDTQLLNVNFAEPAGIYFLIIESAEKRTIIKLLKE